MLRIVGIIIAVMLSASAVGCTNNDTTVVEESRQNQEELELNKDIDDAYKYVVDRYDSDEDKDDMLYKIEKTEDGVLIKGAFVSESEFKELVTNCSTDYAVEQLEEILEPFNDLPKYIEVEARKQGVDVKNVNFYMEIYLSNDNDEFTDLLYSISSKDGVIINSIKHEIEYFKNNKNSDDKSKDNSKSDKSNSADKHKNSRKSDNTNSDDTRTSEEKHWDKHNSDTSKPPTTVVLHKCNQCGTEHIQSDMFKNNGKWYCNDCGLFYCTECGRRVYPKWLQAPSSMDYMHYQNDGNGAIVCGYCYIQD